MSKKNKIHVNIKVCPQKRLTVILPEENVDIELKYDLSYTKNEELREKYYSVNHRIESVNDRSFIELFSKYLKQKISKC